MPGPGWELRDMAVAGSQSQDLAQTAGFHFLLVSGSFVSISLPLPTFMYSLALFS